MEKIAQFDRERIPERVVHARGASAKGFFEVGCCIKSRQLLTMERGSFGVFDTLVVGEWAVAAGDS